MKTCSLAFKDKKLENLYQDYYDYDTTKRFNIFIILSFFYVLLYLSSAILAYFISDNALFRNNKLYLITRCISLPVIGISVLLIKRPCSKKRNILNRYKNFIFAIVGVLIIFVYENPFFNQKSRCNDGEQGFLMWWSSFEMFFFCFYVGFFFTKWTYRAFFFVLNVGYYASFKYNTIQDHIQIGRAIGLSLIYGALMYNFEKVYREKFYHETQLKSKQEIWKKILHSLPEGILIFNSDRKIMSMNNSIKLFFPKLDFEQEFFKRLKDFKQREDIEKLKTKYFNSFGIQNELTHEIKDYQDQQKCQIKLLQTNNSLINFDQLLSNYIKLDFENEEYIFDGIFNAKPTEIRVQKLLFEDELCLLAIFTDLSQRDLILKLEQNIKDRGIILSTVSHELRTPINSTMTILQVAIEENNISMILKEKYIMPCLRNLGMLINLINDILDYSQIQNNKLKIIYQIVDLKKIIYDACMLIEMQCKRKNIALIVDIDDQLPKNFVTDPNRLAQVILNLLSNAIKFTISGYIKISSNIENQRDLIKISVKDTGIGIKQNDMNKLFHEYSKIDLGQNEKLNPTGCGLGLSIAHKLAIMLGPEDSQGIQVESKYGGGSTFWFLIKDKKYKFHNEQTLANLLSYEQIEIKENTEEYKEREYVKLPKSLAISTKFDNIDGTNKYLTERYEESYKSIMTIPTKSEKDKPKRLINSSTICSKFKNIILVVDDDGFNLLSMEMMLKSIGIECELANSGQQAIDILIRESKLSNCHKYAFILMDYNMPVMDGLITTKLLREKMQNEEIPNIPIIGYTAYNDEFHKMKGLEVGMNIVLEKPLGKNKILELFSSIQTSNIYSENQIN